MIHISVIVWALCMLQSVSAFAPEPSSENMVSAGISIPKIFGEEAGALAAVFTGEEADPCLDFNFFITC